MANFEDRIKDAKFDTYGDTNKKSNNFKLENELTIEITLNEYRELVSKVATSDSRIAKAENDRYERNSENAKLKTEIAELKAKLYETVTSPEEESI